MSPASGLFPSATKGTRILPPKKVERIAGIVDTLIQPGVNWNDEKGQGRQLVLNDILIVAPYNAQVSVSERGCERTNRHCR